MIFFFGRRQPSPIKSLLLVIIGWLVTPFSQKRLTEFFCMKLGDYKGRKVTESDFWKQFLIWRYLRKGLEISPELDTVMFFSKTALTIFWIFGLKLVINLNFNLKENYFSEKCSISRYLTPKSSKNIFDPEILKKFPKLRFLAIFSALHH